MSPRNEQTTAIVLTAALEAFAVEQIKAFESDFKKAKTGISNMSNHLLELAKRAEKDGGKEKREELFKALCRHAETVYKQEHLGPDNKEQPIKKLLPFWPVAKSQVLAGIKAGLEMKAYKTVFEVTEATPKATRAPRTTDGTTGDDTGTVSMPKGEAGEALTNSFSRLNRILKAIVIQKPELIKATADSIDRLCDSLEEMADVDSEAEVKGNAPATNVRHPTGQPREQVA